jgi:hypothetical protein
MTITNNEKQINKEQLTITNEYLAQAQYAQYK